MSQLAPEIEEDLLLRLVGVFYDLRKGYEEGSLAYPYSLRGEIPHLSVHLSSLTLELSELIAIIRHMRAYPHDPLYNAIRNVFDFDVYKLETMEKLADVLQHHGYHHALLNLCIN